MVGLCDQPSKPTFVYEDADPLWDKINKIAKKVYRAGSVTADAKVKAQIQKLQDDGYGHYPVCVAKTQSSFYHQRRDARRARRPRGQRARGAPRRRRRVRGDDLRRHHDHAGPAEGPVGRARSTWSTAKSSACSRIRRCSKKPRQRRRSGSAWLKIIGVNIILSGRQRGGDRARRALAAARAAAEAGDLLGRGAAIVLRDRSSPSSPSRCSRCRG